MPGSSRNNSESAASPAVLDLPRGWGWRGPVPERIEVLLRADGGPAIGVGHWLRSLSLARELIGWGVAPVLVTRRSWEGPDLPGALAWAGVPVLVMPPAGAGGGDLPVPLPEDEALLISWARSHPVRLAVCDHYGLGHEYLELWRGHVPVVAAIDDLGLGTFPVDVLLNQNPGAESLPYRTRDDTLQLLGPFWALLREEFAKHRPEAPRLGHPDRVLLSTGGGSAVDPILPALLAALAEGWLKGVREAGIRRGRGLDPTLVLLGGGNRTPEEITPLWPGPVELVRGFGGHAARLETVALAVTAAGSTVLELMCLGIPMVTYVLAPNQQPAARELARLGAGVATPNGEPAAGVAEAVARLLADPGERLALSAAGLEAVDGRGARRAAARLLERAGRQPA